MMYPSTAREAILVEALGEAAKVFRQGEALVPALDAARQALEEAHSGLAGQLAAFDAHVIALAEKTKVQAVKHILARTDEATHRSVELQARAMADAARVAFGGEIGAALQRLQPAEQKRTERPERPWEPWLTHAAAAAVGSAATWILALRLGV
jgi:hypothetical protein